MELENTLFFLYKSLHNVRIVLRHFWYHCNFKK